MSRFLLFFLGLLSGCQDASVEMATSDSLQLAVFDAAELDVPNCGRAVVEIRSDGSVRGGREEVRGEVVVLTDQRDLSGPAAMSWLIEVAAGMPKAEFRTTWGWTLELPGESLVVRAEEAVHFVEVQRILDLCREPEVRISKLEFACFTSDGRRGRFVGRIMLDEFLPRPIKYVETMVRPKRGVGRQEPEYQIGPYVTDDLSALGDKLAKLYPVKMEYQPTNRATGEVRPLPGTIAAGGRATVGDVVAVLEVVLEAGFTEIYFGDLLRW